MIEDPFSEAYALHRLDEVLAAAGNPAAARARIEAALELYRHLKLPGKVAELQALLITLTA